RGGRGVSSLAAEDSGVGAVLVFGPDCGRLEAGWQRVIDHAGPDFFHGDAFELVRAGPEIEARQRAPAQLLGALSGHVHEQETTRDRGDARRVSGLVEDLVVVHKPYRIARFLLADRAGACRRLADAVVSW